MDIPFLDWNGDGRLDPRDIALTLAIAASEEDEEDEDALESEADAW